MTMPDERTRAVLEAYEFMVSLLDSKKTPKVPKAIRGHAKWVLRHFPTPSEFLMIAQNENKSPLSLQMLDPEMARKWVDAKYKKVPPEEGLESAG